MNFRITQIADWDKRLNESYKIREYFEDLIKKEILIPYKIILEGKWIIELTIHLVPDTREGKIEFFRGSTYKSFNLKTFPIFIPLNKIVNSTDIVKNYVDYLFLAIKEFFILNYRKIKMDVFEKINKEIDYNYLCSLPFPAPFKDQKYIGDDSGTVKKLLSSG